MGIGFGCTSKSYIGRIHFSQKWKQWQILLGGRALKITVDSDCSHEMKKTLAPWKKNYDKPRQHIKKQSHHFSDKGPYSQTYGFPISRVWRWELDHKEGCVPKNWCFQIVVEKKTLESLLDWKELKEIYPKGNQPWIFIARTDAEVPILWPLIWRADSLEKTMMLGKIEGKRRRGNKLKN